MTFHPQDQARIDEARARLHITHDPARETLLVTRIQHHAWMLFKYEPDLRVGDMAANMRYDTLITGAPVPGWWWTNAAWECVRSALAQLDTVPVATHATCPSRVNGRLAHVLATEERIAKWGGFLDDKRDMPGRRSQMTADDVRAYDRRKRGLVVL